MSKEHPIQRSHCAHEWNLLPRMFHPTRAKQIVTRRCSCCGKTEYLVSEWSDVPPTLESSG